MPLDSPKLPSTSQNLLSKMLMLTKMVKRVEPSIDQTEADATNDEGVFDVHVEEAEDD